MQIVQPQWLGYLRSAYSNTNCDAAGVAWHPNPASPDTAHIVTASADKTARLFSREGKELGIFKVGLLPLQVAAQAVQQPQCLPCLQPLLVGTQV